MNMRTLPSRRRGVSLIEALVALAIMAFGMLSLVGVQATLRLNSDVSKQRTEATRIATEELENLRLFTTLNPVNGQAVGSWTDIATRTVEAYVAAGNVGNTSYRVQRTVVQDQTALTKLKTVSVTVLWTDRTNSTQSVSVQTALTGLEPGLSGLLFNPSMRSVINLFQGRDATIPVEAKDLGDGGDGHSAFKPFDTGTVVWRFNNVTGAIDQRCTGIAAAQTAITSADLAGGVCQTINARLLAGVLQFDLSATPNAETPAGPMLPLSSSTPLMFVDDGFLAARQSATPAECVSNSPTTAAAAATSNSRGYAITYYCLVYPRSSGWGGRLNVVLASNNFDGSALRGTNLYKSCRYSSSASGHTANADHPTTYCVNNPLGVGLSQQFPCYGQWVTNNLINQNFLVVGVAQSCPVDGNTSDFVDSSTYVHQPTL